MKKRLIALFLVAVCMSAAGIFAQSVPHGQVLEGLAVSSKILQKDVRYAVYLPPGYDTSTRRYPVVFLLHGFTDDESAWIQFGEANLAADRAIESREIPPMILVMPDGGVTWYINDAAGKVRWEDMFVKEFIPFIDATYRTRPKKEFRGVAGLSMGGWGTLVYALKHPALFAACTAFSAGIRTDEEFTGRPDGEFDYVYGNLFGEKLRGQARLSGHYRKNNPFDIVKSLPADSLKSVRILLDCGDDDFLIAGNVMFHLLLRNRGIPHEFRVRDGEHNWLYWRTGITDALKFIGASFNR
jgi:enterochelin esterase-like enzyme